MCVEDQKRAQIIRESIDLLKKVIGNLSQVIELETNPDIKRDLKKSAHAELNETVQKHFR